MFRFYRLITVYHGCDWRVISVRCKKLSRDRWWAITWRHQATLALWRPNLVSALMPRVSVLKVLRLGLETSLWLLNKCSFSFLKQNSLYQTMHLLFDKIFSPPATSAPVERIFSHSGCSWGQTGHESVIHCCRSWCFCVAIMQCSLMFLMPIVCLYMLLTWHCVDTDSCCVWRLWSPCHTYAKYVFGTEYKKAELSQRWPRDEPYVYGCPENFRESLTMRKF